jgi:hypothetical protein
MDDRSKTAAKQRKPPKGKPFTKGDPRINRKGRPPKNSEELNALLDEIFAEQVPIAKGKKVHHLREVISRLLKSDSGAMYVIDKRFGKTPQAIDVTSKGEQIQNVPPEQIAQRVASLIELARKRKETNGS